VDPDYKRRLEQEFENQAQIVSTCASTVKELSAESHPMNLQLDDLRKKKV
jgi:hypothetical protein